MKPKGEVVAVVIEHDDDGWWAYYSAGWCSGSDFMGASHQDHEDTKREIMKAVRAAVKCTCEKCKKDLSNVTERR